MPETLAKQGVQREVAEIFSNSHLRLVVFFLFLRQNGGQKRRYTYP